GSGAYTQIEPQRVHEVGNELASVTGLRAIETRIEGGHFEVVFLTDLRMDEIMRLGLELTGLEYKRTVDLPGSLGSTSVKVNLYVASAPVEIDVGPMRSKNAYRITARSELEPGAYAFYS